MVSSTPRQHFTPGKDLVPILQESGWAPGPVWMDKYFKYYIYTHTYRYFLIWGTRWHSWLRHCITSRKVAGSIPDGVIGIFHQHNPSGRTVALGLTQPLTEMSTRNISWGKGSRCIGLTTLPPSCADCLEIWEPQPPETLWACPGL